MAAQLRAVVWTSPAGVRSAAAWLVAALGVSSVAPLLGWVYGLASFRGVALIIGVPGVLVLVVLARLAARRPDAAVVRAVRVGVLAGIVGTIGYDLFRVPFVVALGLRLLSPIDSYGVLLVGARTSSGLTDFVGWAYHLSNGVGFAVAYAALAWGRHWGWGLGWALVLETATLLTPFADVYQIAGQPLVIALAYAAHIPYGLALGLLVQRGDRLLAALASHRHPVTATLAVVLLLLVVWQEPWQAGIPAVVPADADVAIVAARLTPEFTRVADGACAVVANLDVAAYQMETGRGVTRIPASGRARLCLSPGVHRVRTAGRPFDGGFVIVDRALSEGA